MRGAPARGQRISDEAGLPRVYQRMVARLTGRDAAKQLPSPSLGTIPLSFLIFPIRFDFVNGEDVLIGGVTIRSRP
jgi:hypothetical protein